MKKMLELHSELKEFIKENWKKSLKTPTGYLKYRFIDPAAGYNGQLWDWDSFFCATALFDVYEDIGDYIEGCVLNFLEYIREDGSVPYVIYSVDNSKSSVLPMFNIKERTAECDFNSIKPLLAQMVMLAYRKKKDKEFVKSVYPKLIKHIEHWENTQKKKGLFVWRSLRGSGTDNHPAIYGRPLNSSAGVELNCFMYMELSAMAEIALICGDNEAKKAYECKRDELAELINRHMWDPIDGMYYHLDMLSNKLPSARQEVVWDVPLKFRMWTCFVPMFAGIAPKEYAERMVKDHLLSKEEFWSDFGIRTMAKNEPAYNTAETGNPSNWQGPIWIVSNYIIFRGLLNYGYIDEATKLCENLLSNLCRDIKENGALHEYYNPETGKSNIGFGFMNWNALAGLMVPEILSETQA